MGVILGMIAIAFGIWGIGDIFRGFGQTTVAKVGGTEIRVETFRQFYQDKVQDLGRRIGRPILPDQARALGLDRQILGQLVADALLDERVRALRLGVTEAEVARRITDDPNFKGLTGQFDRQRFDLTIRQRGYTEQRYIAEQRRTALRAQIIGTVSAEIPAPKAAAEAFNRYQNEQRSFEYVVLTAAQAGDVPAPAADVLTKYFEGRKVLFRAPEYRQVSLLAVTPADIAASVEISEADVRRVYDERKATYETPERRQIQQISFPTLDEARAAADKLTKGTTFVALAAERGLKDTDIDLGLVAQTAIVDRAVGAAAFALKPGQVSAPIEGRFGVMLVTVVKVELGQTRTFEQVASEIKNELAASRAKLEMDTQHDKIEDERLGGATLADIAKKFNLKLVEIPAIDRAGNAADGKPIAGLPQSPTLLDVMFKADKQGDDRPAPITGGGFVWFVVSDIKPGRDRDLAEIKDQVEVRWREDEIASRLKVKSADLLDKLKAGKTLTELAAADKLKVETAASVKRGAPPAVIPARAIQVVFQTPKGAPGTVDGANAVDRIVFRVTDVTVPPFDPNSDETKRIDEVLRRALAEDIYLQYVGKLETEIGVTINQNALNQATGNSPAPQQ